MTLRAEIRHALLKHQEGLTSQQLFEACDSAEEEKKFAQNLSVLKAEQKVKVISTTEDDKPKAIYGIDLKVWRDREGEAPTPEKPKAKRATRGKAGGIDIDAAHKRPAKANGHEAQDGVAFALNDRGELGLEQEDQKVVVSNDTLRRMMEFLEKTEDVWKR